MVNFYFSAFFEICLVLYIKDIYDPESLHVKERLNAALYIVVEWIPLMDLEQG
jgi:hypothetical protein